MKLFIALAGLVLMAALTRIFIRSPRQGIFWIIATAPLEKVSVYAGLTWKPFLILVPPLAAALLYRFLRRRESQLHFGKFEIALLAILGVSLLSMAASEAPALTLRMTIQFAILFLIPWMVVQLLRTPEDFEQGMKVLRLSGLGVLLYGLLQFAGWMVGINTHLLLLILPENPTIPYMFTIPGAVVVPDIGSIVRLSSTFFDWNIFASYVLLLLCLSLSELFARVFTQKPLRREIAYSLLGVFILFFTFSRSSWIGMCTSLVILAYAWAPFLRRRRIQLTLAALILLASIGFATSVGPFGYIRSRMTMMFEGDASIYKHTIYAQAALEMFRRSPALGVGLHNYSDYYARHFDPNDLGTTSHSAYLSFFAETGILGGIANLTLILLVLSAGWKTLRKYQVGQRPYSWAAGMLAAYGGLLVSSFFYLFYNQVYLWVLVGMIIALYRLPQSQTPGDDPSHHPVETQT